ncbi:MAG: hypothetical protein KDD40_00220 [Bdellovibrionales bacterium]|nr:hypothetical protein [Bdellovibrionales bacterium]
MKFRNFLFILFACSTITVSIPVIAKPSLKNRISNACVGYLESNLDLQFVKSRKGTKLNIQLLQNQSFANKLINYLFNSIFGPKLGMNEYNRLIHDMKQTSSTDHIFVQYQRAFKSQFHLMENSMNAIPKNGPLIIVANHPGAGWEIFSIVEMVLKTRSDFKVFANEVLASIPGLGDHFIPVPIFNKRTNSALKQAEEHLFNGGVLIMFPAAEVSSYEVFDNESNSHIVDGPWSSAIIKNIERINPQVVPVFVNTRPTNRWLSARNSSGSDILRVVNHFGEEIFSHYSEDLPMAIGRAVYVSDYTKEFELRELFPMLRRATYLLNDLDLPEVLAGQNLRKIEKYPEMNRQGARLWLP